MQVLKRHTLLLVLIVLAMMTGVLLAACGPSEPATTTTTADVPTVAAALEQAAESATSTPPAVSANDGYPAPQAEVLPPGYPAAPQTAELPEAYPPSATEEVFQEPRFRIDQDTLVAGATTVEGQAPPGVPVAALDV